MDKSIKNGIIGFVVGDVLGVPVEFMTREKLRKNPVVDLREYGTHNQPLGSWSDDTSMTLATMDSIIHKEEINTTDIGNRFLNWYRKNEYTPFGKVFFGLGNTGKSGYEGVVYKNVIATYLHGPLLPKNPQVCDYLLERALQRKYGENVSLSPLPDKLEHKANSYIFDRYNDKKYVLQETIKRYT